MNILTTDRRRSTRGYAAHSATLYDRRGGVLTRGRTSNICGNGAFLIANGCDSPLRNQEVVLEITVPSLTPSQGRCPDLRTVRYLAKVIHRKTLGNMVELGLEFLEKFI